MNKKTLVIGGGGFIGSHLSKELTCHQNRSVIAVGRSSSPRFTLPNEVIYKQGDAGDIDFIGPLLDECDEVVDLAYATVPKTSFEDPVHDVIANLPASVTLLRESAKRKISRLILISSGGTVYGNSSYLPIDESHPTTPISPYGITKLALEKYALMFHQLENLPVIIVRPSNPYGPKQPGTIGQGFIGAAIAAILKKQPVVMYGENGTVRDYIYIDDLVSGLVAALDCGNPGEIYNIGTGIGFNNRQIIDVIKNELANPAGYQLSTNIQLSRSFDVAENVLSSARLTYVSGWRPNIDFKAGLKKTWLAAFQNK